MKRNLLTPQIVFSFSHIEIINAIPTLIDIKCDVKRSVSFNKKCDSFFKWFKTDMQVIALSYEIGKVILQDKMIDGSYQFDFSIQDKTFSIVCMSNIKNNAISLEFIDFNRADKIGPHDAKKIALKDYVYAYKLIPRKDDSFFTRANYGDFKFKIMFSKHWMQEKGFYLKKYNFQRLSCDILKSLSEASSISNFADGTPMHFKATQVDKFGSDALKHSYLVTCSLTSFDGDYTLLYDKIVIAPARFNILPDEHYFEEEFLLTPVKVLEKKQKPTGLKIVKKLK